MERELFEAEHDLFRSTFRRFLEDQVVPNHLAWDTAGLVDREMYREAGKHGFLGMAVPDEYGGGGVDDFRFNAIIDEEIQAAGVYASGMGIGLHNDVCLPYLLSLGSDEQKQRWLPGTTSGDLLTAIAMTEPGTGSDLASIGTTAVRDGDSYIVNGSKTFITNGIHADLVITAVKTDPSSRHQGMSLIVVERGMAGFERGRNLDKIGQHSQDTAELFFSDVRVPVGNLLGEEGAGFRYLMRNLAQERLSIAVTAVSAARAGLGWTLEYCTNRTAFGQPIAAFQNTRFQLAEMATLVEVGQTFVDRCIRAHLGGVLTAEEAAMAKWWCTDVQLKVIDAGLQLHGGYGYMREYPIARAYADARVATIYGGTNEIMKEIIGKRLTR